MSRPLPYCDAVSWRDETKTIKPIINEAFVASSGDIITDYNDLYCLFTCHVASPGISITMSAFVIGETTRATLHCSKLAFESSAVNYLNKKPQTDPKLLNSVALCYNHNVFIFK